MKTSLFTRLHEWIADRVTWVQYPNITPANQYTKESAESGVKFKTPMSIGKRIDTILASLVMLIFGVVLLAFVLLLLYVLFF